MEDLSEEVKGGVLPTCKFSCGQQGALQALPGEGFSRLLTLGFLCLQLLGKVQRVLSANLLTSVLGLPVTSTRHAIKKFS